MLDGVKSLCLTVQLDYLGYVSWSFLRAQQIQHGVLVVVGLNHKVIDICSHPCREKWETWFALAPGMESDSILIKKERMQGEKLTGNVVGETSRSVGQAVMWSHLLTRTIPAGSQRQWALKKKKHSTVLYKMCACRSLSLTGRRSLSSSRSEQRRHVAGAPLLRRGEDFYASCSEGRTTPRPPRTTSPWTATEHLTGLVTWWALVPVLRCGFVVVVVVCFVLFAFRCARNYHPLLVSWPENRLILPSNSYSFNCELYHRT